MFFQSASTPETTRRLIIKVLLINTVTHFLANTPLMRTAPCEISLAAAGGGRLDCHNRSAAEDVEGHVAAQGPPPLTALALHQRLQTALSYAYLKPHQGLGGATPAEMFYGIAPARQNAKRPSRAYENRQDDPLFEIAYIDPERFLPFLWRSQKQPDDSRSTRLKRPVMV